MAGDTDLKAVLWQEAQVTWTGMDYTVVVPINLDELPATWMGAHAVIVTDQLGHHVGMSVEAATASNGGYSKAGEIRISGLREPFPKADMIRTVVDGAVRDAYAEAVKADRARSTLAGELRSAAAGIV